MKTYYIGADVHKQSTTIAVRQNNKIITMTTIPTQIDPMIEFLEQFRGRKYLTIEENPLPSSASANQPNASVTQTAVSFLSILHFKFQISNFSLAASSNVG